ncbi:MAG: GAF domain-containing protein, partial [Anaerolineae bacterium]|nr:GAF domain-containing protein [Anaerolineae bacterium]
MAKRNLAELETAKREIELLYAASRQLAHASTIAGLLDAVSDYPRERGAFNGQLFTFPDPTNPDRMETVAAWGIYPERRLSVGFVIDLEGRPFARYWLARPDAPTLIPDVMGDERVDGPTRKIFARLGARALALLPLFANGRWIGVISFYWSAPHAFDARDTRIFTALQQQLAPVLDSIRLAEQTQRRAAELERAKNEMDILLDASRLLVRASTSAQLLEAVSAYARQNGAVSGTLFYFDQYEPRWLDVVASWASDPAHLVPPGARFDMASTPAAQVWLSRPEHPFLLSDATALDAIDPQTQAHLRAYQLRGVAQLPLFTNGRWIGALLFGWDRPYAFAERDTRIFTVLQQQLAPVADSLLLFEQSQRRAAWAERLARTNAALSQATDERSILMAVAELGDDVSGSWSALAYTLPGNARSLQFVAVRPRDDAPPP